jgi:hypothetical protein
MDVIERMSAMRRDGATYRAIGAVTGHGPKSVQRIGNDKRVRIQIPEGLTNPLREENDRGRERGATGPIEGLTKGL